MHKANLEIAQSMLSKNLSIDHVAELMSEHSISEAMSGNKHNCVQYWIKQIQFAIKHGELKA